tara:strand:+ start:628 stop:1251 length:624 start_codon:yes stop_codon:yes gene_type:complete
MNKIITRRSLFLYCALFIASTKFSFSSENKLFTYKIGNENAKINIKEYFSLTCGHCANFHLKTFPKIKKEMIDSGLIKFEFVDYPLDRLAMYAVALVRSLPNESYLDAISILFKNQKKWAYSNKPLDELLVIAKMIGISKQSFDKIIKNYDLMQKVLDKMEEDSNKHDIQSTPTFIINDKYKVSGMLSFDDFKKKLNKFTSLKKSNG